MEPSRRFRHTLPPNATYCHLLPSIAIILTISVEPTVLRNPLGLTGTAGGFTLIPLLLIANQNKWVKMTTTEVPTLEHDDTHGPPRLATRNL